MVTISSVKARDIMQADVVTLSPSGSIESAISTFEDLHISGAPVVDESGKIVGMLSAFDIAKAEHVQNDEIETERGDYAMIGMDDEDEAEPISFDEVVLSMNDFSPTTNGRTTVSAWMSTEIVSVGPDCGLRAICRLMVKEHVHRVPVVKNGKLVGIISTLDIVRCVAGDVAPGELRPLAARTKSSKGASARPESAARSSATSSASKASGVRTARTRSK